MTAAGAEAVPLRDDRTFARVFFRGQDLVVVQDRQAQLEAWTLEGLDRVASYGAINNYSMSTSFDGSMLAFGAGAPDEPIIHILDPRTGEELVPPLTVLADLAGEDGFIIGLAFNADGTRLAASTNTGAATVLDTTTWEPVGDALSTGNLGVVFVAFSSDGRHFATVDGDGQITLRDPESFQPLGPPLVGTTSGFRTGAASPPLAFTADGRYLVSTVDHQGRVWDLESRTLVGGPFRSEENVNIAPSTNGRYLAVAQGERVLVYEFDVGSWFDVACAAAGRNMTAEEWSQFGPGDTEPAPTCPQWEVGEGGGT
jgi:WD40 repeat protein